MIHFDSVLNRYRGIRRLRSGTARIQPGDPGESEIGFGADRDPARLAFFSDAVFAIAVTLLVLDIHPPQDTRHLLHGLLALWPSYMAYAVTFLLIGQIWANHHVMFDHIRVADRKVLFLNTVLLMDIAFLPFAAATFSAAFRDGHGQRTAVVFYGITFELAAILFNAVWDYAHRRQRLLGTTINSRGVRAIRRRFRLALTWIAIGILLCAVLPLLGVVVIAAFIAFYWRPIPGESTNSGSRSRLTNDTNRRKEQGTRNLAVMERADASSFRTPPRSPISSGPPPRPGQD